MIQFEDFYFFHVIDYEINSFRKFFNTIEKTVEKNSGNLKKEWDEAIKEVSIEEEDVCNDYYIDLAGELGDFQQLLYKSFAISFFSFTENYLSHLCDTIYRNKKTTFSHKDIKGSGVTRAITYVKKVLKIDFPTDSSIGKDLDIIREIRNGIVHNDGRISEDKKNKIDLFIKKNPGYLKIINSKVELDKNFIDFLFQINNSLIKEAMKIIESIK